MKDFDTWNIHKKNLEEIVDSKIFFREREIWWASIGLNLGDEQDGKNTLFERPVLIVKKFNPRIAWCLPMTTRFKQGKYYFPISDESRNSSVILSQLRLISVKRLIRLMKKISPRDFREVKERIANLIK